MATRKIRSDKHSTTSYLGSKRTGECSGVVKLWILRILVLLGGWKEVDNAPGKILYPLGLGQFAEGLDLGTNKKLHNALITMHTEAEKTLCMAKPPMPLIASTNQLNNLLSLSDAECRLLEFAVLLHTDTTLERVSDCLGSLNVLDATEALSDILNLPLGKVQEAFQPKGMLTRSGLLSFDRTGSYDLKNKLNLLSSNFAERMLLADCDPVRMLQDIIMPSRPPILSLLDFPHFDAELRVLLPYLERTIRDGTAGVNIFIYGQPGTGKTQLSRILAQSLSVELFQVSSMDENGDPVDGEQRLCAYRAGQFFFAQNNILLMFDEAEDIFGGFGLASIAQKRKGWINNMLEENPVPTIWAANSIDDMDPAFIRRFDMVLELPVPPRSQREKIIRDTCGDMLPEGAVKRFSYLEHLAPAIVTRASAVTRVVRDLLPTGEVPIVMEMLINKALTAQSLPTVTKVGRELQDFHFDSELINTQTDLTEVAQGLCTTKTGRLCLYGPPGTGKTAFGRWLADQIGIPLLVKRASDLLSKWVGETEKNIARCFAQAEQECSLLMLDEVDSFLQDRADASQSWEVSGVNEMLTQMEAFQGVFVASTNLMDSLDQAALRRFDLKLKFDHLTPDQAWTLFVRKCGELGFESALSGLRHRLQQLKCLTPGDFAAVMRRHRFSRIASATDMLAALEAECAVKADQGRKTVGF